MRVRDLPEEERPRERLFRRGAEALSDRELLALILGKGRKGESALDLAAGLIADYGGVGGLRSARPEELSRRAGVGPAKAAAVVAALRLGQRVDGPLSGRRMQSPADIAAAAEEELAGARRERVLVLICDASNRLRTMVSVADGAVDHSPLPIREVLNAVLRHDGRAFAVAHNHPSGDPTPSEADRRATAELAAAAKAVGLRFLDHIIVADGAWTSATTPPRTPD